MAKRSLADGTRADDQTIATPRGLTEIGRGLDRTFLGAESPVDWQPTLEGVTCQDAADAMTHDERIGWLMPSSRGLDSSSPSRYLDRVTELKSSVPLDAELRHAIAEDPLAALAAMTALRQAIHEREREAVFRALETHTWREVGEALGVSKQAAFQRFGREWALQTKARLPKSAWKQTVKERLSG